MFTDIFIDLSISLGWLFIIFSLMLVGIMGLILLGAVVVKGIADKGRQKFASVAGKKNRD